MNFIHLKIISFWFIMCFCFPLSLLANCKDAFPEHEKTDNPAEQGKNSSPVSNQRDSGNVFHSLVETSITGILKPEALENMELKTCGTGCLKLVSKTSINFEIKIDSRISSPEFHTDGKSKTLKIPSIDFFQNPSLGHKLRYWLVGHELHPYFSEGKIMMKPVQSLALSAYQQALHDGAKSFLHICPTGVGKTLVLTKALIEQIRHSSKEKNIAIATVNRVHIVEQLSQAIKTEIAESTKQDNAMDIQVINWNSQTGDSFAKTLAQASRHNGPTVFVMTTQSLKKILKEPNTEHYKQLSLRLSSIFIDEAHHLGAQITKDVLLNLQEQSEAFLYGATATPIHHEVSLRSLFEKTHWSYLTKSGNLFESHSSEGILRQLSEGIERGDLTPFDNLYFIADTLFKTNGKEGELFTVEYKNNRKILNPDFYEKLAQILYPVLRSNEKGFIVTATIREAERLTEFLSNVFPEIQFDSYHQERSAEEKRVVIERSHEKGKTHYIVAVRSLDEGIDLPHLSAYIDLNANIPIKNMLQRIGRVLRLKAGKFSSDIILLIDYRDEQVARELLNILDTIKTVSFSRTIRDNVNEELGTESTGVKASPNSSSRHIFEREDLAKFRKILEETVQKFWSVSPVTKNKLPPLEVFQQVVVEQQDIRTQWEYQNKRKEDERLKRFPSHPERSYEGFKWPGRNRVTKGNRPPLEVFQQIVVEQKVIRTQGEYAKKRKKDEELKRFPSEPENNYEDFIWPGKRKVITKDNLPPVEVFQQIVVEQKDIRTQGEYAKKRKKDEELKRFPSEPENNYEGFIWPEMKYKMKYIVTKDNRPPVEVFQQVVEQKNIRTQREYDNQRKKDEELQRFPSVPKRSYQGFKWPGRSRITKVNRPPVEVFQQIVVEQKGIGTQQEYQNQRKKDEELKRFPNHPEKNYPGFKWPGRSRVTKVNRPPLEVFQQVVVEKKGIRTQGEYAKKRKEDSSLKQFPSYPERNYENFKWPGRENYPAL